MLVSNVLQQCASAVYTDATLSVYALTTDAAPWHCPSAAATPEPSAKRQKAEPELPPADPTNVAPVYWRAEATDAFQPARADDPPAAAPPPQVLGYVAVLAEDQSLMFFVDCCTPDAFQTLRSHPALA